MEFSTHSVPSDSLDALLVCEDVINENTTGEQCGFISKSCSGLKVHIRTQQRIFKIERAAEIIEESKSLCTQTEETCPYCKDTTKSPKNIEAQR